jgi:hypothetical protein
LGERRDGLKRSATSLVERIHGSDSAAVTHERSENEGAAVGFER